MEISELINPKELTRFDDFCKQVDLAASKHLNELHQETFKLLKNKRMMSLPLIVRKNLYRQAMASNKSLIKEKTIQALNIFYNDFILKE